MPALLDTLEQTEMWYGEDGFPYKIEEMETSHIENVVRFLGRRAQNIYERHQYREYRMFEDAPADIFDAWMRDNMQTIASDPLEWLAQRPLLQRMEQILNIRHSLNAEQLQLEGPNAGVMVRRD
jgi:hypothetical protein